jgi:DNA-binding protein H-NS
MEAKVIIVSSVKSNKSDNKVWAVAITGEEQPQAHCKSAYKAMRFAFLLKKRTGFNIAKNSLEELSQVIKEEKAKRAEAVQEIAEDIAEKHSVDNLLAQEQPKAEQAEEKPKKQRKPRSKESAEVVALI